MQFDAVTVKTPEVLVAVDLVAVQVGCNAFGCNLSRLHWVIALLLIAVGCTAELVALGCTAFDCSWLHGRVGCTGWLHFF